MRNLSGNQIREEFLRFFEGKGHRRVHSSSLVPANDPTLLFTNAGMNQFKDVFLGAETRDYKRATTSQKCVRAGGKHNDLENVGFTRRHHTFFEMLGNFSFGDYFKRDAIAYAWELLTSPDWFGLDPAKLYVTIFEGDASVPRDDEAEKFWLEVGVPKERIFDMGAKDNFWAMGDTGPCGPCSEIYFDLGLAASETGEDKPFGHDDQRYMEIWNLVFMQFDRSSDGLLTPLPKPSIDTGMGLERIACVLQGKLSNYDTDLFTLLIAAAEALTLEGTTVPITDEEGRASLRIIADHSRAATFLISDGVIPSNEGRGYVLRKILRRAIRHGQRLGQLKPFMYRMVEAVKKEMAPAYPELEQSAQMVAKVIKTEEDRFAHTIAIGLSELERQFVLIREDHEEAARKVSNSEQLTDWEVEEAAKLANYTPTLSGRDAFRLYETFGLPKDFIYDACRDSEIVFDDVGFEAAKEEEQARARASWKGGNQKSAAPVYRELPKTEFEGYSALRVDGAKILALVKDGLGVQQLNSGESGEVVTDATSFYADSGGQVGDVGWLYSADHNAVVAKVTGCKKPVQGIFAHQIIAKQPLSVGDSVDTVVNGEVRNAVMRNHTGTHLLHAALRQVLGTHVKQAGSLNDPNRLRFDFSHFAGVADEDLAEVESIVNAQVLANTPVETLVDVPIDQAIHDLGATALFGEKYGDLVRVVRIGGFSTELCGGTHTAATGEIGLVKITAESAVASGTRRVEAVTGTGSLSEFRRDFEVARVASHLVGAGEISADTLRSKIAAQEEEMKKLRRELEQMRMKSASAATAGAATSAVEVSGIKVLAQRVDALDKSQMRNLVDELRGKLGSGVVVLGAATPEGKASLIVGVTKDLTARLHAGKIVSLLAVKVGGKGGGRPDLAEAGGPDAYSLETALASAPEAVAGLLA
jgi:alanyl-tRNA synthetase